MIPKIKRMTFSVTPEMEPVMDRAKQLFYNHTQSDMIRTLILAGLDATEARKQVEQPRDLSENCVT